MDNTSLSARGHPSYDLQESLLPTLPAQCRRSSDSLQGSVQHEAVRPKKTIKHGFDIWVLADALNGYFCNIMPYTSGAGSSPFHGLGEKVVLELTTPHFGENHHVYCDNFFTTIILQRHLLQHQTYGCGTVCSD